MKILFALVAISLSTSMSALASPLSQTLFGHRLEIRKAPDGFDHLFVDRKPLLDDQSIDLIDIAVVAGVPVAIGVKRPGGNACSGSTFILRFPDNSPARIDGPLDTCSPGATKIESDRVVVEIAATPQMAGSRWAWTPSSGFGPETKLAFAAKSDDGWSAMRSRQIGFTANLPEYADLDHLINERVGALRPVFLRLTSGPGNVGYHGNLFIGTSCQAHACDETGLLVVADISTKRLFVAMKDQKGSPTFSPSFSEWPSGAGSELGRFRQKWLK